MPRTSSGHARRGAGRRELHDRRHRRPSEAAAPSWQRLLVVFLALGSLLGAGIGAVHAQSAPGASRRGDATTTTVAPQEPAPVSCRLRVPADPLSARGLATPWVLAGDGRPCDETDPGQAAFVEATILDPATGDVTIYRPLVVNEGGDGGAAVRPQVPRLPARAVVGINVGFNGDSLTLDDTPGVTRGRCDNGIPGSIFGQVIFCNDAAFFAAAHRALAAHLPGLAIPPLGTDLHGDVCPTTSSFDVVDQDAKDNSTTTYLAAGGRTAQATAANAARLAGATQLANGSDHRLFSRFIVPALGCDAPRTTDLPLAKDVTDPRHPVMATSMHLMDLSANVHADAIPAALIPAGNPMVLVDGEPNLEKLNRYRVDVDEPPVQSLDQASTAAFCEGLLGADPAGRPLAPAAGLAKLFEDRDLTIGAPSPEPDVATNLFGFLVSRWKASYGPDNLGCEGLTRVPDPAALVTNDGGLVTDATLGTPATTTTTQAPASSAAGSPTTLTGPTTTAGAGSTATTIGTGGATTTVPYP